MIVNVISFRSQPFLLLTYKVGVLVAFKLSTKVVFNDLGIK